MLRPLPRLLAVLLLLLTGGTLAGIAALPTQAAVLPPPSRLIAPTPADLAADDTVQLSPAIQAQAEALGRSPVALKNWVTSHIRYVPYHGAVQGSAQTLESGRGNAYDQASLLIALLRASGIPARPVKGTVEAPIARLLNALELSDPAAALVLLADAGIPAEAIRTGGSITAIRLEHAWAEAWIDATPSRGARQRSGDGWIELDASFKALAPSAGLERSLWPSFAGLADAGGTRGAKRARLELFFRQTESIAAIRAGPRSVPCFILLLLRSPPRFWLPPPPGHQSIGNRPRFLRRSENFLKETFLV